MLKINKKVEYALMIVKYMNQYKDHELITVREISNHFKAPFDTIAKVMQKLTNGKIISSIQGVKGGYQLKADLESITYLELHELVTGNSDEPFCYKKNIKCTLSDDCNIKTPMNTINREIIKYLRKLTLNKIIHNDKLEAIKINDLGLDI